MTTVTAATEVTTTCWCFGPVNQPLINRASTLLLSWMMMAIIFRSLSLGCFCCQCCCGCCCCCYCVAAVAAVAVAAAVTDDLFTDQLKSAAVCAPINNKSRVSGKQVGAEEKQTQQTQEQQHQRQQQEQRRRRQQQQQQQ